MKRRWLLGMLWLLCFLPALPAGAEDSGNAQRITIEQELRLPAVSLQKAKLYWPIPQETAQQELVSMAWSIDGLSQPQTLRPRMASEDRYQNRYAIIDFDQLTLGPNPALSVRVSYEIVRRPVQVDLAKAKADYRQGEREVLNPRYSQANRRVPLQSELLQPYLDQLKPSGTRLYDAKAIYNLVVDTMEYKKVGSGWGYGDTHWACSQKYGNCTDFHALFTSLARAQGIPVRFEIGLPIDLEKPAGSIAGYHCWVMFYLPGLGWTPVDASEAKKNLARREFYFGRQAADRVLLSRGRDLVLGQKPASQELNYFVFPYLEIDGKATELSDLTTRYRRVPQPPS